MKNFGDMLCGMRDVGQLLSVGIFQLTIFGSINAHVLKVMGRFKVTRKWVLIFCKFSF
jgi:hypothetical protein